MGKDCRKKPVDRKTVEALKAMATVKIVGCQKICKPAVVGIDEGDGPRWFKRVNKAKAQNALLKCAAGGPVGNALRKRECPKRAGKLRR